MDSVLEKITLYDILGYLLPGSVLTLLVIAGMTPEARLSLFGQWEESSFFLKLGIFIFCYLAGIVLSEVTEWLQMLTDRLRRKRGGRYKGLPEHMEAQVVSALTRSGIREGEDDIKNKLQEDKDAYSWYMYGVIHNRPDCRRVHNYGSAYVMCRNTAAALLVGATVMFFGGNVGSGRYACFLLTCILFAVRGHRFRVKRDRYVMLCFVDRFTMQDNKENG